MNSLTGQRVALHWLAILAVAGAPQTRAGEGKLAPVIDLNPRHVEAASPTLEEPHELAIISDALPLSPASGSAPKDLTAKRSRHAEPLVKAAVRSPIEPIHRGSTVVSQLGANAAPTQAATAAHKPSPAREQPSCAASTAATAKPSSPIVRLAATPVIQIPPAETAPLKSVVPTKLAVAKLVEETPQQSPSPARGFDSQAALESTRPVVQLADATPLLVALQEPPAAPQLPAPKEEMAPAGEGLVEAEEIDAFDLDFKPMIALSARTKPEAGELPKNYAALKFAQAGEVAHHMGFSRSAIETEMAWEAPAICHQPLYFEDINLERHGYKVPLVQPVLSAAHFFGRVPLLPYLMVNEGHRDCQYTLGHYRPGDYAPYSLYVPRIRFDATAAEAAAAAGVIFAFP